MPTLSDIELSDTDLPPMDPLENLSRMDASSNMMAVAPPSSEREEGDASGISIWAARGILMAVAVLWGTNFGTVKYLEKLCFHPPCTHPPSEFALARFGVAALVASPLLVGRGKEIVFAGLECGLYIALGYFAQAAALQYIDSGKCAFICSLTVVVVPLLSFLLEGRPVRAANLASAALALVGVGVLEGVVEVPHALEAFAATDLPSTATVAAATDVGFLGLGKGDLLALGQPFGFGYAFMRIEHYVEKFKEEENSVLTLSAAQCVSVGIMSLLWVLYDYHWTLPNMEYMIEPHRIGAIAWTGIMTTVVAIYLQGIALQTATATEAALIFSSEPVWAFAFGAWLLNEQLTSDSYIGGTVILAACLLGVVGDMGGDDGDNKNDDVVIDL